MKTTRTTKTIKLTLLAALSGALLTTANAQSWLTNGLVAYYPFNGNANDATGLGKDGIVDGAALTTDRFGHPSSAYSFDGVGSRIATVGTNGLPNGGADFTLSVWVAADQPISGDFRLLIADSVQDLFQLALGNLEGDDKMIQMYLDHYGPAKQSLSTANLSWGDKVWFQIAVARSSGLVSIYRDGILVMSQQFTNTNNVLPGLSNLAIGRRFGAGSGHPWKGKIDDIRIYNRALSADEVTMLYASESGPRVNLIKAVKPSFSNLTLTTNYQLQVSAGLNIWTNHGTPFTATNTSMVYPQYWDVDNWGSLFFRLQEVP